MRKISDKTWIICYITSMVMSGVITKKSEEDMLFHALKAAVEWARSTDNKPQNEYENEFE